MTTCTLELLRHRRGAIRAIEIDGERVEIYVRLRPRRILQRLLGGLIWGSGVAVLLAICAALGWWIAGGCR
jgi:hypothetical protein